MAQFLKLNSEITDTTMMMTIVIKCTLLVTLMLLVAPVYQVSYKVCDCDLSMRNRPYDRIKAAPMQIILFMNHSRLDSYSRDDPRFTICRGRCFGIAQKPVARRR